MRHSGALAVDQSQMDRGLTVLEDEVFVATANKIATRYAGFINDLDLDLYRFRYLQKPDDIKDFDDAGDSLFAGIASSINYERRTGPGDIVETAGFIVYPPNSEGTGRHRDPFFGDTLVRLTLPIFGEGNLWSSMTGKIHSKVGSLLVQNLCNGCEHSADTLGFDSPRLVAFWDIPADPIRNKS